MQNYQANYGHQPQQLPVDVDRYDQNTFNPNLPHGNDVTPPVNPPPNLNPQLMGMVAGQFRQIAQSRCGRSKLHTFTYNMWAQNYFNNQEYPAWLQRVMDFAEYLIVEQGDAPQVAIPKAVEKVYFGALALYASQFPQLQGMVGQDVMMAVGQAGQVFEAIIQDVAQFQQRGRRPSGQAGYGGQPQQQMGYGGGQQMGYSGPPQQQATMQFGGPPAGQQLPPTYASQPQQQYAPPHQGNVSHAPGPIQPQYAPTQAPQATSGQMGGKAGGRYLDTPGVTPTPEPTPQPQNWTAGQPLGSPEPLQTPTPPQFNAAPTPPVDVESEMPLITNVDDIDLSEYVDLSPNGPKRPYDEIWLPGGIEVRPAHLSGWKRTRSDAKPYAIAFDPTMFILFHVKWPDGVVEEKLVEYEPDMKQMDYMAHEIDTRLRGEKIKPNGKVVASHQKILDVDEPPKPIEEVRKALDEGLVEKDALNPVVLEGAFTASSDVENEEEARRQVCEQLGLLDEETSKLPAHEYLTARLHPLVVPEEGRDRLQVLATSDSFRALARGLVEAVNDGVLSRRYYRLLNDRLTEGLNTVMKDNLSLDVEMDSFVDDIDDLMVYLDEQHGDEFVTVLDGQTPGLLKRWLNFHIEKDEDDEDAGESLYLMDETVNYQLPWSSEQVASLNLTEEPAALSSISHPTISRVVKQILAHHQDKGTLKRRRLVLITTDGQYIEVLRGWLVDSAVLLKLL